ncbi:restriction endonuclease subunit S [Sulfurimonas autotrophica]|uniref:Restriction endonuclease S subunit n=1 Tax=Sulfurimonas autotrophica (strain ATCC BAA-671 / DSM 16294 / JCM 11897 / OK10) TaxID=563040 RepID=E0UTB4_SULAO|nr:restriction endonuclease subunit S [Sulfurimonas autotrophica]ADN08217.1 Restriction endonuclease S subunit [Sulfurimonas autotrophica DSM 16294]
MKSKYKPYPSYKDSGIAWLGEVPIGWDVRRLKTILQERREKNSPVKTKDILSLCMYRGVIPYSEKGNSGNKAKDDLTAYKLAYPNDIVLNSMNVVAGSVGLSKYFGAVSPVYYMLYPRKSTDDISYFNAIFQSESFQKSLIGLGNGILVKQSEKTGKLNTIRMKISMDSLNDVLMPIPPFQEQQTIANYLDNATAKIDTLIEKQTKLIALLKEKRQAVISTAVTRGLDSSVPMKDSGVEWLGEIPEHWEVKKFKYLFEIRKRISGKLGYDILSITQKGIKVKDIESGKGQLSSDYSKYQHVYKGDYAMNHMDLLTGFVDLSKYDGVTSPDYRVFSIIEKNADANYYLFLLQMGYINKIFYPLGQGSSQFGRWRLPSDAFKEFQAPFPPQEEQKKIAKYIDDSLTKFTKLTTKATKAIELLKERRTALISAIVTGKIDVREIA